MACSERAFRIRRSRVPWGRSMLVMDIRVAVVGTGK
jgi:hypothetical protein